MNKINYQKELDKIILNITKSGALPRLMLHSCCAPCSSYVIEYLNPYFNITVLYYNPNISPVEEYEKRKAEQIRFIKEFDSVNPVHICDCDYDGKKYEEAIKGLENEPEGGLRCVKCFYLRLEETAKTAKKLNFDYFCTTLSISPLKKAELLNKIGKNLSEKYDIKYLPSDFKKREGYKRSVELSKKYNLYRQNFCGCVYSET